MKNRRRLVIALGTGALSAPLACLAQQQRSSVARVGSLESTSSSANQRERLLAALRELGLVESKNILIECRWAEGNHERLPGLAAELVQMKVDVILAGGGPAVQAAKQADQCSDCHAQVCDPVRSGFVASLSRPRRKHHGSDRGARRAAPPAHDVLDPGTRGGRRTDRAATIDKILKGANPGELPAEEATKVELVINLKTAKAIGLTIAQQLLLQADKVIE